MAKRKMKPIGMGCEGLLPPYQRREVTGWDVVQACEVLLSAGFTEEALIVLAQVLAAPKGIALWEPRHG